MIRPREVDADEAEMTRPGERGYGQQPDDD